MRILVVEDDAALARGVIATFKKDGYAVDHVVEGEAALDIEASEPYNTIVLDVTLPGLSGFEVLKKIRARGSKTPILMLTARDTVQDRVTGLDLGADDYVLKPFDPIELSARVRALMRRGSGDPAPTLTLGALSVDRSAGVAHLDGRALDLRRREWAVLEGLATRAGKVVTRERLENEVFGYDDPVGPNALEVYVGRLRKKLEATGPLIRTIRGVGYMIDCS
ncbi:MAG: response regulator transcription factor [Pseudomonadota bacterium]|uniref:response regulator transcription factor n=1 Tax=unclassified Phenylobacterium TaxID=2640670 RepID=UPI0006FDD327|nr:MULTISPECIES: response regulator transcription factor [unclassified Phenylobacterium]KRB52198.1 two-component system response regulator [Phenylobacterium sp. Root700]MBT9473409.1 response regulator transcription factor [Phenylobacterium sp.]